MIFATYNQMRVGFRADSTLDITGRYRWPVEQVNDTFSFEFPGASVENQLGLPIFGATTGINAAIANGATFPWRFTMNGLQADASLGVDEWHWYLSQHTDESASQYLTMARIEGQVGFPYTSTYSGTILMGLSSLGTSVFGTTLTPTQLRRLFDGVGLYTRRLSDGTIWMFDPMKMLFQPVPT